jgi:predicted secreted Zn-dependent protease
VLVPEESRDQLGLSDGALPVTPVTELDWRRSFRCGQHGSCVEIAKLSDGVAIRDGKAGDASPVLTFSHEEWATFVAGVKAGEFS